MGVFGSLIDWGVHRLQFLVFWFCFPVFMFGSVTLSPGNWRDLQDTHARHQKYKISLGWMLHRGKKECPHSESNRGSSHIAGCTSETLYH